jgi:chromate reductase
MSKKVAVIIGSLRRDSYSKKVAEAIAKLAPASLKFEHVPIGDLPFYSEDLETAQPPQAWVSFRDRLQSADAVLFVTPEYNRSVPGVLKNAIDVGSRPYGKSAFSGKPAAVVSISLGGIGGFGANHHLRQSLVFLNMPTLAHEAYIGNVGTLFDAAGNITNESSANFLSTFAATFDRWIAQQSETGSASKAA